MWKDYHYAPIHTDMSLMPIRPSDQKGIRVGIGELLPFGTRMDSHPEHPKEHRNNLSEKKEEEKKTRSSYVLLDVRNVTSL